MAKNRIQRYKQMRLGQLRAFCECIRCKSFSAASRALNMSQPAVWQQVRALERDFGASLVERHGREWKPTEEGNVLLELSATIVGAMDSLQEAFEDRCRETTHAVTIIGAPSVFIEELATPIQEFRRQHPQVRFALLSNTIAKALDLFLNGDADMAIMSPGWFESTRPPLVVEPLAKRPTVLAVPSRHPLSAKRRLSLTDIVRYPLILPPTDSEWRRNVDDVLRRARLLDRLQVSVEVSLTLASRRFVSLGMGVSLLPLPQGHLDFPGVCFRPVGNLFPPEEIVIFWRRGAKPRPHARLFADFVRRQLNP